MSSHTPGPWKIVLGNAGRNFDQASIRSGKNPITGLAFPIASVRYPFAAWGQANGQLIAAAPDLLAVLMRAVLFIGPLAEMDGQDELVKLHDDACDAIAKAIGVKE